MKPFQSISNNIFDELLITVETIGVDKSIRALQEARSKILILENSSIDSIITYVSQITGVLKERIFHGTDRNDERKMAIALCVYFIKNQYEYSYSDLRKIMGKDESALFRYHKMIENIPEVPKTEFEKKLKEYYKKIEIYIITEKMK